MNIRLLVGVLLLPVLTGIASAADLVVVGGSGDSCLEDPGCINRLHPDIPMAARAAPGTLVHALIAYRDPMMPAAPAGYVPAGGSQLVRLGDEPDVRRVPRYTPEDLGRALSEFAIERAVLLGNGMQEFLFRR